MAKDLKFCDRYDATVIQQLYKIITNRENNGYEDKDIFPVSLVQSTFDAFTGTRLDQILALCNSIYVPYAGSIEATRLKIGLDMRRKGLIVTFRDLNNNSWTQRYKKDGDISDEAWKDSDNWESWDFDSLAKDLAGIIQNIFVEIDDYPKIGDIINENVATYVQTYLNNGDLNDNIMNAVETLLPSVIQDAINNYFHSEEGANTIKAYMTEALDDVIGEYLDSIYTAVRDNERVTANALARHEMAITELQNRS